jgi:hypothetical protein
MLGVFKKPDLSIIFVLFNWVNPSKLINVNIINNSGSKNQINRYYKSNVGWDF